MRADLDLAETPVLGPAERERRLGQFATGADGADRARVLIVRDSRVALIERFRQGSAEELGADVTLGSLRVLVHVRQPDGSWQRQWCFDASTDTDEIAVVAGPELAAGPEDGTHQAVWLDLAEIGGREIWPSAPARLLAVNGGRWPAGVVVETTEP